MRSRSSAMTAAAATTAVTIAAAVAAPLELPAANPVARVSQQVGLTEIAVEYTSPAARGKAVWGARVPWDQPWSPDAAHPATVRFSRDVTVGDRTVRAGTYTFTAVPGKTTWTLQLEPGAVRVKARPRAVAHRERLTFMFSDFTDERASLDLEWEKIRVSLPIQTHTAQQVQVGLDELDTTWRSYANAARFMLETKKDFDTGLVYADRSLALEEDWYTLWVKAALLAAKHDYTQAVEVGQRSYDLGRSKLGDGFALEPELGKALADWRKQKR